MSFFFFSATMFRSLSTAIVPGDLDLVWDIISQREFSWWTIVDNCILVDGLSFLTLDSSLRINFKDGHSWTVAMRELSSINHKLTFEVITCEPEGVVSAAIHSISLQRITTGSHSSTFVQWTTDFSSDATLEVVTDASFKRKEALDDLTKCVASSPRALPRVAFVM